tara:strand:- start:3983 stop:4300 length:318 start_codon:yes stop_codon:yes gene_type:complete
MRKYLFILFLLFSCSDDRPNNLISEKKMESIIFDIMILNASSTFDLKIDKKFLGDELIYKKYNIDSTQLYESELYYSKNPRIQFEIYSNVKKRILRSMDSLKNTQ